jgi:hypothetical protein
MGDHATFGNKAVPRSYHFTDKPDKKVTFPQQTCAERHSPLSSQAKGRNQDSTLPKQKGSKPRRQLGTERGMEERGILAAREVKSKSG